MAYTVKVSITNPKRPITSAEDHSMLRGLAVKIAGYPVISGLTDVEFLRRGFSYFTFKRRSQARRFVQRGDLSVGLNLRIRIVRRRRR